MEFKFSLSQRVVVPGFAGKVQGVIAARKEFIGAENEYDVRWLEGDLSIAEKTVTESELQRAQPGFVTPLTFERVLPEAGEPVRLLARWEPKRKRPAKKRSRKKSRSKR